MLSKTKTWIGSKSWLKISKGTGLTLISGECGLGVHSLPAQPSDEGGLLISHLTSSVCERVSTTPRLFHTNTDRYSAEGLAAQGSWLVVATGKWPTLSNVKGSRAQHQVALRRASALVVTLPHVLLLLLLLTPDPGLDLPHALDLVLLLFQPLPTHLLPFTPSAGRFMYIITLLRVCSSPEFIRFIPRPSGTPSSVVSRPSRRDTRRQPRQGLHSGSLVRVNRPSGRANPCLLVAPAGFSRCFATPPPPFCSSEFCFPANFVYTLADPRINLPNRPRLNLVPYSI